MLGTVNDITDEVNDSVNILYVGLTLSSLINSLHTQSSYYTNHFTFLEESVNLLSKEVVTPEFLHFSELQRLVKYATKVYNFRPAVPLTHLESYCSLLQVSVSNGAILLHLPFIGLTTYRLHTIPFPSNVIHATTQSVILSQTPDLLLHDGSKSSFAYPSLSDLVQCKNPLFDNFSVHCIFYIFHQCPC